MRIIKKLLLATLILLMGITLVGCSNQADESKQPIDEDYTIDIIDNVPNIGQISGGYTEQRDLTSEELEIFNEAMEDRAGNNFEPLKVSTQVVAGTKYNFYCKSSPVTYPASTEYEYVYVYIFKPLGDGKPTITEIVNEE